MLNTLSLVETADGSKTIYNSAVGENYHSSNGAFQESEHVFIKNGLSFYSENFGQKEIKILEVGFGTGLNFLLSADYAINKELILDYVGIEAYPLPIEFINKTEYSRYLKNESLWNDFIKSYSNFFEQKALCANNIQLQIAHSTLDDFKSEEKFDIIYFDAFARNYQSEMWTAESIAKACQFLKDKGIFVTYSVTGDLKRTLKSLGFQIERPAGAAGKREMMRALFNKENAI